MSADEEWLFIDADGDQNGPYAFDVFCGLLRDRIATGDMDAWCESLGNWTAISSIPLLQEYLSSAPTPGSVSSRRLRAGESSTASKASARKAVKASAKRSSESGWTEQTTDDGQTFYVNDETGETTWEKPAEEHPVQSLREPRKDMKRFELPTDGDASDTDVPPDATHTRTGSATGAWAPADPNAVYYWVPDPKDAFIPGQLLKTHPNGNREYTLDDGRTISVPKNVNVEAVDMSTLDQNFDDLVVLGDTSEPLIVHSLRTRFAENKIYTNVGTILIAINPYCSLGLYTPSMLEKYMTRGEVDLPPHVYVIADQAFRGVLEKSNNQAIIISGESGAGKTETTKQCLQFLAECAGTESNVEQRILLANPVLEAFGNAKTVRNSNSSRFGKYIEVFLDSSSRICGASNTNYLLEKSRVVSQMKLERNYHIFFQLCRGADDDRRQQLRLRDPSTFAYLNQVDSIDVENVDDALDFASVEGALQHLGLSSDEIDNIFRVTAAVLHLGDIQFKALGERSCEILNTAESEAAAQIVSTLLEVPVTSLGMAFTSRVMQIKGQSNTMIKLSCDEASGMRHATAKFVYAKLFDWLIGRINRAVSISSDPNAANMTSIGVLDIFGFEIFENNSFEQLCINYTNEKLQQHFNRHTFKLEEKAYADEGIEFEHIDFVDNQVVLDLIEAKSTGILALLDEEIRLPRTTDATYFAKLGTTHAQCKRFERNVKKALHFIIVHYAGPVDYSCEGFLEKNNDTMSDDLVMLLDASQSAFLRGLFPSGEEMTKNRKATLGGQFQKQLSALITKLESTSPHYVRCIKPNTTKSKGVFDGTMVFEQLRYSGVFEALQIRKSGFPYRYKHEQFCARYRCAADDPRSLARFSNRPAAELARMLVEQLGVDPSAIRIGKTQVLYRTVAHKAMESKRNACIAKLVVRIQSHVRRVLAQRTLRVFKEKVGAIRKAIADDDEEALSAALDDAADVKFEFAELQEARKVRSQMAERRKLRAQIEDVLKLECTEDNADEFQTVLNWAEKIGYKSDLVDRVRSAMGNILLKKQCFDLLREGLATNNVDSLDEALDKAATLGVDTDDEFVAATQTRDELRAERAIEKALKAAIESGGYTGEGSVIDYDQLESALGDASSCRMRTPSLSAIVAEAKAIVPLRKAMATALQVNDEPSWSAVEAALLECTGFPNSEIAACRRQLTTWASTVKYEAKIVQAIENCDAEAIEFCLQQIGSNVDDRLSDVVNSAKVHLHKIVTAKAALRAAVSQMDPRKFEQAIPLCDAIENLDRNPEVAKGLAIGRGLLHCERTAREQMIRLDREEIVKLLELATSLNYNSPDIVYLRSAVSNTPEKLMQLQLKTAVAQKDRKRILEVTAAIKDHFFRYSTADMFNLGNYPGLKSPMEWASAKVFSTQKQALADGFMAYSNQPIHSALTRDLGSHLEKMAKTCFKSIMCFMGDRQNTTKSVILARDIVAAGIHSPKLRVEILCQLVKQLNWNPSSESIRLGWQLVALCLQCFPPPSDFENYFEFWIRSTPAPPNMLETLHRSVLEPAKVECPSDQVIESVLHGRQTIHRVSKVDIDVTNQLLKPPPIGTPTVHLNASTIRSPTRVAPVVSTARQRIVPPPLVLNRTGTVKDGAFTLKSPLQKPVRPALTPTTFDKQASQKTLDIDAGDEPEKQYS
ncbi:WW domain containing protein [Plasmodiophora brassicae]|uniref:Uncharacterized protein n=1 Tax=Plasmodiophora brassicae TaxID=37360 RepID=A0A3P3Y2A3_PLABS|nr:unnamed protein product [Plasmodiophora brassicae]